MRKAESRKIRLDHLKMKLGINGDGGHHRSSSSISQLMAEVLRNCRGENNRITGEMKR
jgi:hypothetical protein